MICVAAVIHVVRASTVIAASIHKPAPLVGLVEPLVRGPVLR
jgi:hypothetical protein